MKPLEHYLAFGVPDFTEAEIEAVTHVMRSCWLGMGAETLRFETELANYLSVPQVVTVNSCTSALFLSLLAAGVGPGDEVIVPSLTWCATANAALYLGAQPVFCDIDADSMCVTPETIAARLTPRTRAVLPVHYGGYAIDVAALRRVLPDTVAIIEDAAHAIGARYPQDNLRVGSSGNLVCFSFYANKNLSAAEGGAIALTDETTAEHLRRLRMNGMESSAWSRYTRPASAATAEISELGYKMNFTDLQAAIARVQLARLDAMADHRAALAARYREQLQGLLAPSAYQAGAFSAGHARHLLVGVFDEAACGRTRDDLLLALRARNIGASIHYRPLHSMPFYHAALRGPLPVTEWLASRIMTLPISARMQLADVDEVAAHLRELLT